MGLSLRYRACLRERRLAPQDRPEGLSVLDQAYFLLVDPLLAFAKVRLLAVKKHYSDRTFRFALSCARGACASVPYSITGRLSSVRQLAGSGLDSGPTI